MRVLVSAPAIKRRPDSGDPAVYTADELPGGWNSPLPVADYEDVVKLWRGQSYRTSKLLPKTDMKKSVKKSKKDKP
jgi:hypothetical protein